MAKSPSLCNIAVNFTIGRFYYRRGGASPGAPRRAHHSRQSMHNRASPDGMLVLLVGKMHIYRVLVVCKLQVKLAQAGRCDRDAGLCGLEDNLNG